MSQRKMASRTIHLAFLCLFLIEVFSLFDNGLAMDLDACDDLMEDVEGGPALVDDLSKLLQEGIKNTTQAFENFTKCNDGDTFDKASCILHAVGGVIQSITDLKNDLTKVEDDGLSFYKKFKADATECISG